MLTAITAYTKGSNCANNGVRLERHCYLYIVRSQVCSLQSNVLYLCTTFIHTGNVPPYILIIPYLTIISVPYQYHIWHQTPLETTEVSVQATACCCSGTAVLYISRDRAIDDVMMPRRRMCWLEQKKKNFQLTAPSCSQAQASSEKNGRNYMANAKVARVLKLQWNLKWYKYQILLSNYCSSSQR